MKYIWMTLSLGLGATVMPPTAAVTIGVPTDFESGTTEGWTGGSAPVNRASGGAEGEGDNFLMLTATGGNGGAGSRLATFHGGPAWTGDYASAGVTALTVDLMNPSTSLPLDMRLVLFGPNSPNNRWTSVDSTAVPNDGVWRTYRFPIAEEALTRVQGNAAFDDMLSDVVRMMLRHNSGAPSATGTVVSAQLGIDDILLEGPSPLDCNRDGQVDGGDLACVLAAGGAKLLDEMLAATALVAGDMDADGSVGFTDFLVLSSHFGQDVSSYTEGDLNGDGAVGFSDFLVLSNNFGKSSLADAVVPEPHGTGWLTLGLLFAFSSHRAPSRGIRIKKSLVF